ncbi:eosinophil peroxidase-like [Amblyraja radiata]|uniref:eosinophil peroxidase-like n=1 Tax=Amblyraja radiata TaxID=386614 RepID=UPI0014033922|nr:eosinophil peroxidase-like [Amblyraja radiata]
MASVWSLSVILFGVFLLHRVHADDEIRLGSPYLKSAVRRAMETVDRAYKETRKCQKERLLKRDLSPHDLMRFIKHPLAETRVAVRSAEYMETTLNLVQEKVHRIHRRDLNASDLLTSADLVTIARITGCQALRQPPVCIDDCWTNRYRTFTSICNNRQRPRRGASNTLLIRWLPARYEDGVNLPVGWTPSKLYSGFPVPLVREVSNIILRITGEVPLDIESSHFFMQWGQWIDHDMTLTPQSGSIQTYSGGINCENTCIQRNPCFPIRIPPNDTRIANNETCMPFFRSAPACGTGELGSIFGDVNTRQQINALTSYIDVNEVYGSTDCLANKLRNLANEDGMMAVNQEYSDNGREYLPFNNFSNNLCGSPGNSCGNSPNATPCFIAGDVRVNEQLALLSFHTMFLREHNRIAKELKRLNPHWDGDTIYHETRKIMGAFQQIINHRDYVPILIGSEAMERFLPDYQGYDESVNPSIANAFAAAAFRFGHTTVRGMIFRLAENYEEHPDFPSLLLHQTFFAPWRLIKEGGVDPIVRGLLNKPSKLQTQTKMMHDELRERLFEMFSQIGLDLGSLNMQRSRDHGIAGYNAWRRFCGLSQPRNESELSEVLNNSDLARKLIDLYGTPDNIELWIGGISEPFVEGGKVGPLLACLLGHQFQNLRNGDRFWWENEGVFTKKQRKALTEISMSRIICDTTGIDLLPRDAFKFSSSTEDYVRCKKIPQVDLKPWKEKVKDLPCGPVPKVQNAFFSTCNSSVKYTCQRGFTLKGAQVINCGKKKKWESEPPSCSGGNDRNMISFNLQFEREKDKSKVLVFQLNKGDNGAMRKELAKEVMIIGNVLLKTAVEAHLRITPKIKVDRFLNMERGMGYEEGADYVEIADTVQSREEQRVTNNYVWISIFNSAAPSQEADNLPPL